MARKRTRKQPRRLPRIGPCRDPLDLWFLEFKQKGAVLRRYFGEREEAQAALAAFLTEPQERMLAMIRKHVGPDGWAEWDHVFPDWDPGNCPPQFAGVAARSVWKNLERRGLVEDGPGGRVRVK